MPKSRISARADDPKNERRYPRCGAPACRGQLPERDGVETGLQLLQPLVSTRHLEEIFDTLASKCGDAPAQSRRATSATGLDPFRPTATCRSWWCPWSRTFAGPPATRRSYRAIPRSTGGASQSRRRLASRSSTIGHGLQPPQNGGPASPLPSRRPAARRATEKQILEDADHLVAVWNNANPSGCRCLSRRQSAQPNSDVRSSSAHRQWV